MPSTTPFFQDSELLKIGIEDRLEALGYEYVNTANEMIFDEYNFSALEE